MNEFPLQGVIGIIADATDELELAVQQDLQCVEIRADLLLDRGLSTDSVMDIVRQSKQKHLACLFTLRHPSHGGKFDGSEEDRISINQKALSAGAAVVALELDTEAADRLLAEKVPMVLSYHDFDDMPKEAELAHLSSRMLARGPAAVKIVPTASTLRDCIRMLHWVEAGDDCTCRIGFAMGATGTSSRILATVFGSPITYASFGAAVAPGQVPLEELVQIYRIRELNRHTLVIAVFDGSAHAVNRQLRADGSNLVAIPFEQHDQAKVESLITSLRIDEIRT